MALKTQQADADGSLADTVIVIPARYASTRFPGKPLTQIQGPDGIQRSLVHWSYLVAKEAAIVGHICVATDDARIAEEVGTFDGAAVFTPESCRNGTERVAACLGIFPDAKLFVNLQGDALLTPPHFVRSLVDYMRDNPDVQVCTAGIRCTEATYRHLAADAEQGRVGGTTVVINVDSQALYFSKRMLPYLPPHAIPDENTPIYLHLGLYAYRREALERYVALDVTMLETVEGLEQLRFLVHDIPMDVLVFPEPSFAMVEVNNMSDVAIVEQILRDRDILVVD
jgi:3-deoxy-manno-octulosonate cytidylyltransferase (CMP-KDO synthetase)